MGVVYHPGETQTIFLQVLRLSGSVPTFPGDYTAPQAKVIHNDSGLVTDLAFTSMTQLDDNIWTIPFAVPATPYFGDYLIEFKMSIDGVNIEASDTFKVEPTPIDEAGEGSCTVSLTVLHPVSNDPIAGVDIYAFLPSNLSEALAHAITDVDGEGTIYLDPGTYKVRFHKVGFIDETHDLTVNGDCTHVVSGD